MRISVLGAGTMGAGIAHVAAVAGMTVHLYDVDDAALAAGRDRIDADLDGAVERQRISREDAAAARSRITFSVALAEAVLDADLVVEAVAEDMGVKRDLLARVDAASPAEAIPAAGGVSAGHDVESAVRGGRRGSSGPLQLRVTGLVVEVVQDPSHARRAGPDGGSPARRGRADRRHARRRRSCGGPGRPRSPAA